MIQKFLNNTSIHFLLFTLAQDLARLFGSRPCKHCGGRLHVSNYERSPNTGCLVSF